jgi:hypothetical protein
MKGLNREHLITHSLSSDEKTPQSYFLPHIPSLINSPVPPTPAGIIDQVQQRSECEVVLYSRVDPLTYHTSQDHLQLIEKIWKSERMCAGGVGRGQLAKEKKYTPQVVKVDPGDRILSPRMVGELAGGSRRTKTIKTRLGGLAKSLSPARTISRVENETEAKTKIFFAEGTSAERFSSVLAKIVENHPGKYS